MTLLILLGLINWFGTLLIVESEFFRPLREWIEHRFDTASRKLSVLFWAKVNFMINCHMCAGTWVGFALSPFAPAFFGAGVIPFLLVGLLIKAIGHLVLVLQKVGESYTNKAKG